jgi:hypothetical protein
MGFLSRVDPPNKAPPSRGGSAKPRDSAGVSRAANGSHTARLRLVTTVDDGLLIQKVELMTKFNIPRGSRIITGLVVVSAFAAAPVAAQAATTPLTGTLSGSALAFTVPTIAPFTASVSGVSQTVYSPLGTWSVTDNSGTGAGYSITVADSGLVANSAADGSGTTLSTGGASLSLTPTTATAADGNTNTGPVAEAAVTVGTTASTIDNAPIGTGQGEWDFAADPVTTPATGSLAITIPGDAQAGYYSDTLTYTTAAPVAS